MDLRRLANLLIAIGLLLVLAAVAWWFTFYGPIVEELDTDLGRAIRCLYSNSGPCGVATGLAQLGGKTPYEPMLAWIGASALAIGLLLRLSVRRGTA